MSDISDFRRWLNNKYLSRIVPVVDYDHTHPERHHKGLVFAPQGEVSDEVKKERNHTSYAGPAAGIAATSSILDMHPGSKSSHARDNIGLWEIGSKWLIWDQPNDGTLGNDYMTQQFLRNQPSLNIPLVKEMRRLSEPTDKIHFTLMSRAPGVRLDLLWPTLTRKQKTGYSNQLADCINQLRQFTAPVAQKVDGSLLDDMMIGLCGRFHPPGCKKIGQTTDEWFQNIAAELRRGLSKQLKTEDSETIEEKLQELKDNFPKGEPYVLTHGDLSLSNIIVKDAKIQAILDWEMAGYYPWWAERWLSQAHFEDHTYELVKPVWAKISPELDEDAFDDQVMDKVEAVSRAFRACEREHPNFWTEWLRPGFCKCKPFAGRFNSISMGNQLEHIIGEDAKSYSKHRYANATKYIS
ncbi:MAG: hypothetical protein Q9163_000875 [Psora crenata]